MIKTLKPALLMAVAMILWSATIYLFMIVAPWTTAIEVDSLPMEVRDKAINAKWVAAIKEHGRWLAWERGTVSQRPAYFTAHLLALLVCGVSTFLIGFRASKLHKEQRDT